jgi:hypothetical protein
MRIPGPALVLPLFLAGCALPPAVTVATLVVDGLSYVATGKSPADHAISAFAHEDCALHRVVEGEAICDPDGNVLIALAAGDPADENWYLDPEIGVLDGDDATPWGPASDLEATAEPAAKQPVQLASATGALETVDDRPIAAPALTPAPVGQGTSRRSQATAIMAAAQSASRGSFADAQPAAKPQQPQSPARSASHSTQAAAGEGQVATFAVIGSYRIAGNARRMVDLRSDAAIIQTTVVDGTTTYRVLVDQPVEQARNDGFSDAWPVRLCANDLESPPCGHFVISQAGVYLEMEAN